MIRRLMDVVDTPAKLGLLSTLIQRGSVFLISILVGRVWGINALGYWSYAQMLSLSLFGICVAAFGQLIVIERNSEKKIDALRQSLLLSTLLLLVVFAFLYTLMSVGVMKGINGFSGLFCIFIYTLGMSFFSLYTSYSISVENIGLSRGLLGVAVFSICAVLWLVYLLDVWGLMFGFGVLCGIGTFIIARLTVKMRTVQIRPDFDLLRKALPLALGNILVNPVFFIAMTLVSNASGSIGVAVIGVGNQLRNIFLMLFGLISPIYLAHIVEARKVQTNYKVAGIVVFLLLPVALAFLPRYSFSIFSKSVPEPDFLYSTSLALVSVPVSVGLALVGQHLIAKNKHWSTVILNSGWVCVLFLSYWILTQSLESYLAMAAAIFFAYTVMLLFGIFLRGFEK